MKRSFENVASKRYLFTTSKKSILETVEVVLFLLIFHFILGGGEITPGIVFYGFWILSAIMASLYGTLEGLFAALLSSLAYLIVEAIYHENFFNLANASQIAIDPLLWIITAVVLGEIRSQHNLSTEQVKEHLNTMSLRNENLLQTVSDLKSRNRELEEQLQMSNQKLEEIIDSLLSLIHTKPTQILLNIDNTVQKILGPEKFSVYGNGPGGLEVLASHGWQSEEKIPLRVTPHDPLYENIVYRRETLVFTNPSHLKILDNHGMFASPLYDPNTDEVFGMFKIEKMGRKLDTDLIETAKDLCQYIGYIYALAKFYQDSLKSSIYSKQGKIFSDSLYQVLYNHWLAVAQQVGFPLSTLHVVLRTTDNIFFNELRVLSETIRKLIPPHALIFQGKGSSNELTVLVNGYSPRKMEALEIQITKALQEPPSIFAGKVYLTRKMEYFPPDSPWE